MNARFQRDYPIEILFDWSPGKIEIPSDWTPFQADEMITTLELIEEKIWILYENDLMELARHELIVDEQFEDDLAPSTYIEDDIPF